MLHDHARRVVVLAHGRPRGVHVEVVVVRHLLALMLRGVGEAMLGSRVVVAAVERGGLVRVLAVAQVLRLREAERAGGGELVALCGIGGRSLAQLRTHPAGDGPVVGVRGLEHAQRQLRTRLARGGAAIGAHLGQDAVVAGRVSDHGHALEVLRGAAQHRRPADVDVLDARGEVRPASHRLLERVEIHHHHVDHMDAVFGRLRHMVGVVALRKQAAVDHRVQRLHTAVHHLGELRHLVDGRDRHPGLGDGARRAARRDDLRAELLRQGASELHHPRLVRHRHQNPLDLRIAHMALHPFFRRRRLKRAAAFPCWLRQPTTFPL